MPDFSPEEMDLAVRALSSTVRKMEKALATLTQKENPCPGQIRLVEQDLQNHRRMLALVRGEPLFDGESAALSQDIHRYVDKIEAFLPKFAPGTSQHTLAVRRIAAYRMAWTLMKERFHDASR